MSLSTYSMFASVTDVLLSVNRVQGDRGAAVPAAVSHFSTPVARRVTAALDRLEQAEQAADTARQKVLGKGAVA